jgi:copper chaperone NosL
MLISSAAGAGQALVVGEETRFYDDVGCLAKDAARLTAQARLFVQATNGAGWVDVESLWFAKPAAIQTPMGYGLAAYASEAGARGADRTGDAMRWEEVVRRLGDR